MLSPIAPFDYAFDQILRCFCAKYAHFRAKLEVHLQQQKNSLKTFYYVEISDLYRYHPAL